MTRQAVQGIAAVNLTYSTAVPRLRTFQQSEGASAVLCTTYSNELQPKIGGVLITRTSEYLNRLVKEEMLKACKPLLNKTGMALTLLHIFFLNLEAAPE
jgi:hypothetical protein